jgi:hypothetical protein
LSISFILQGECGNRHATSTFWNHTSIWTMQESMQQETCNI